MSLSQKISDDLKKAMKARDVIRISSLRMLKASMKNKQVELGRPLEDNDIRSLISSQIRKGKEAVEEFRKGGRGDLVKKEESEIEILYGYLPEQITDEQIERDLKEIISELGAEGPKDLGKVMKAAMARMAGKVQGKEVNEIAKRLLG
jgi:uncharacterized protein